LKSFSEIQNFELNHQRDPIHPSKKIKVEKWFIFFQTQ
jgi:hypothetical protein